MKKIAIIEDEAIAAEHLKRLLSEAEPSAEVCTVLQSIEESVEYFTSVNQGHEPKPDLVFMDIHLADGLSFRIFDHVHISSPIVFTTAYDQYALEAFRVNSVDYLLKPISIEQLRRSIEKLRLLSGTNEEAIRKVSEEMRRFRSHFLIPVRDKLVSVDVNHIACLYVEDKITRALLYDGTQQIIDRPLDSIMEQLDPRLFFRANRQYIIAQRAVKEIAIWPISKLAITLSVPTPDRIIISKARVPEFKEWYTM